MVNGRTPFLLALLALILMIAAVLTVQPYSADSTPYAAPARGFIRSAIRQDSTALAALSFELPDVALLKKSLDATAWGVADVLEHNPDLPIGVVALPPVQGGDAYRKALDAFERARKIFDGLGAKLLGEGELEQWAIPLTSRVLHDGAYA